MNTSSSNQLLHQLSSQPTSDAPLIANGSKPGVLRTRVEFNTPASSPSKEEAEEGRTSAASSASASSSWHTETSGATRDCKHRAADVNMWSHSSSDGSSKVTLQQSHCGTNIAYGKFPDSRSQVPCLQLSNGTSLTTIGFQLVLSLVDWRHNILDRCSQLLGPIC